MRLCPASGHIFTYFGLSGYAQHHHAEHGPKSSIRDKVLDLINRPDCKEGVSSDSIKILKHLFHERALAI